MKLQRVVTSYPLIYFDINQHKIITLQINISSKNV